MDNARRQVNDRSLLWTAFLFSVGAFVFLFTQRCWWISQTLSYSLWAAMAGFCIMSLIPIRGIPRTIIRIFFAVCSVAALYDPLDLLPSLTLTNNAPMWFLFGLALPGDNPQLFNGKKAHVILAFFIISVILFLGFSYYRLDPAARKIPNWAAQKGYFQTGRIVTLYLTIFFTYMLTRIEAVNNLAGRKAARWILGLVCLAFSIASLRYRTNFFSHWYGTLQFLIQPVFLYAVATVVLLLSSSAERKHVVAKGKRYDVFISYRKAGGAELADLVKEGLLNRGYTEDRIFMDTHSLGKGDFADAIKEAVRNSANVVLVVSKGCFDNLREDSIMLSEIRTARDGGVNIVPFCFGAASEMRSESIPEDVSQVLQKANAVKYSHDYPQASYDRLKTFLVEAKEASPVRNIILYLSAIILVIALMVCSSVWGSKHPRFWSDVEQEILTKGK